MQPVYVHQTQRSTIRYGGTMKRKASAVWQGDLKTGKGAV